MNTPPNIGEISFNDATIEEIVSVDIKDASIQPGNPSRLVFTGPLFTSATVNLTPENILALRCLLNAADPDFLVPRFHRTTQHTTQRIHETLTYPPAES